MRSMVEGPRQRRGILGAEEPALCAGPSTAFGGPPPLQMQGRIDQSSGAMVTRRPSSSSDIST